MKTLYSVLTIMSALTIIGMVMAIDTHQIYAPRDCAGCAEFKKLTTQFEKDVIEAASVQPPDSDKIQELLGEYSDNVVRIFEQNPPEPE